MSIWADLNLPEPYPIDPEEIELIIEDGDFQGVRYGLIERRNLLSDQRFLSARDRRRLRRGNRLRDDCERAIKARHAIKIGGEIAEMSNHERLEFFARAGKTPVSKPT